MDIVYILSIVDGETLNIFRQISLGKIGGWKLQIGARGILRGNWPYWMGQRVGVNSNGQLPVIGASGFLAHLCIGALFPGIHSPQGYNEGGKTDWLGDTILGPKICTGASKNGNGGMKPWATIWQKGHNMRRRGSQGGY